MAMKRCGQLRNVFGSADVPLATKISIYKAAVMSLMTYGCEAWSLTAKMKAKINGANSRCMARLTGRSVHSEASPRLQTFDIITAIRIRKWKWLGHILRTPGDRLTKLVLRVQFDKGDRLNMLEDVPEFCSTFEQLVRLAQNRKTWRSYQPTRVSGHTRSNPIDNNPKSPSNPSSRLLRSRIPNTRCVRVSPTRPPTTRHEATSPMKTFPIFRKGQHQ